VTTGGVCFPEHHRGAGDSLTAVRNWSRFDEAPAQPPQQDVEVMRIVKLIYQSYHPQQGRYPRVSGQARILREAGIDVRILACDRDGTLPEEDVVDGVPVTRLRIATGEMRGPLRQLLPLMRFYRSVVRWLAANPADMVHCHNLDVLPLGYLLKRRSGCRLVFEAHEPNYYALWPRHLKPLVWILEWLDTRLALRCDAISVTNAYQVEKYRRLGVRRVALIGNYPAPDLRVVTVAPGKFAGRELILGRFGTFYPGVGLEHTIEIFRRLLARDAPVRLVLGGRVVDAYRGAFDALIAPVQDRLEYTGAFAAHAMPALYGRIHAALLVYPKNDWFRHITPRKFFDAVANGVPVIITDIGGLGDTVRQHDCGLVVDEEDPEGAARAIEALAADRERWRTLADNALRLANSTYGWTAMCHAYVSLMEEVHGG
jgi:glycosyltransferase involved in cell wall biosynthesis